MAGYLAEVMRECAVRRYRWVLIEERLEGARLGTMDVFGVASKGAGGAEPARDPEAGRRDDAEGRHEVPRKIATR